MEDLSLVSFDDLMAEINKANVFTMKRRYIGNRSVCIAATELMQDLIKNDLYETFKINPEET